MARYVSSKLAWLHIPVGSSLKSGRVVLYHSTSGAVPLYFVQNSFHMVIGMFIQKGFDFGSK